MAARSLETDVPSEIWSETFRSLSYQYSIPDRYQQLYACMHVCKRWYALIMADPWLWCDVSMDCSPLLVVHILERSKNKPLHVDCDIHYQEELDEGGHYVRLRRRMTKFADKVQQSVYRWSTLNIDILHLELDPFVRMLELPAPRLRSASIEHTGRRGERWHRSLCLFQHRASDILELHLGGVPIFWDSPILSGLRRLSLANIDVEPPSALQIYNLLRNCTRLEEIDLHRVTVVHEVSGESPGSLGPPITLPNLRDISVQHAPCHPWSTIFGSISSIPACRRLVLSFQDPTDNAPQTSTFLSSSLSHLQPDLVRLFAAPLVHLFFHNYGHRGELGLSTRLTRFGATVAFNISYGRDVASSSDHVLEWAPKVITAVPRTLPVELSVCADHPFAKLSSVQFLKIVILEIQNTHIRRPQIAAVQNGYVALLKALAGKGSESWSRCFAFPFLKLLRLIIDDVHEDDLLEMLRCRQDAVQSGNGSAAIASGQAVRPFQISFGGSSSQGNLMSRAAEIVGQENVFYGCPLQARFLRKTHPDYKFEREPFLPAGFFDDDDEQTLALS